jgi:hypothetical protein
MLVRNPEIILLVARHCSSFTFGNNINQYIFIRSVDGAEGRARI